MKGILVVTIQQRAVDGVCLLVTTYSNSLLPDGSYRICARIMCTGASKQY